MQETPDVGYRGDIAGKPSLAAPTEVDEPLDPDGSDVLAPAEAFKTLGNEVRIAVLLALLSAERSDDPEPTFSDLQRAAGSDSSAGFAYHLRQLDGQFIRQESDGYVLTPAGRRVAEAIVAGTFTPGLDPASAS